KADSVSFTQHMEQGAVIAGKILTDLEYDSQKITQIQRIIKVHDLPEIVFKMNNISATLVVEADRLDRYGHTGLERFKTMFGADKLQGSYWEEARQLRRDGLKDWFRTQTAIQLSQKLAGEMGLFD
ncbi:MAG: metal-dependent phosphohydrolase, partial [Proteobacteria bacterium]|nr:metal-dependent phosphohydrolase [Pseudomonadota bacterium]